VGLLSLVKFGPNRYTRPQKVEILVETMSNNNNNNKHICIVPRGHDFRGARVQPRDSDELLAVKVSDVAFELPCNID